MPLGFNIQTNTQLLQSHKLFNTYGFKRVKTNKKSTPSRTAGRHQCFSGFSILLKAWKIIHSIAKWLYKMTEVGLLVRQQTSKLIAAYY